MRGGLGTLGVLAVGTYLARNPMRRALFEALETAIPPYDGTGTEAALWFELTRDNQLVFHSPKVEMGQGIFTAFAQLIAEEMDLGIDQVRVQGAASSTGILDGMSTGGSLSVATLWGPLRELAATMREMIKLEAARKMQVEPASLKTEGGVVKGSFGTITYAVIAEGVEQWELPEDAPSLKTADFTYIGKPIPRVDLSGKVFGEPVFGLDAERPGMLHAAIIRPAAVGATFKSADTSQAEAMPGVVRVVQMDDWVGVVAESFPQALEAKEAIEVQWEVPEVWTEAKLRETLQVGQGSRMITQKEGSALSDQDRELFRLEFSTPLGAHAQMEPNGALADYKDGKLDIILSTQVIRITRDQVAKAMKLNKEDVNIIPTHLGGGFGRRLNTYHAVQAAQLSKAVGRPVKYIFTREEEFQNDLFRPPTHHLMKGRLDKEGYLESLEHHYASGDVAVNSVLFPGIVNTLAGADFGAARGSSVMYDGIPNQRVIQWHTSLPFATSWWRSLGLLANTFAIESFVDELALRSGKDPVEFRLKRLGQEGNAGRIRRVIEEAARLGGYRDQVVDGRAMGFAASIDAGSPAAQVVEVSIEEGRIRVHKVCCAFDCGLAVNPDQVRAQCEGSIIMGISASLYEKMTIENGELAPVIFGPYKMALMKDSPKEIDIHLIQGAEVPLPVGEPPLGPIGAAIANAVRRLTGLRLTDIPLQEALERNGQGYTGSRNAGAVVNSPGLV